jgi:hypothetical protein
MPKKEKKKAAAIKTATAVYHRNFDFFPFSVIQPICPEDFPSARIGITVR